MPSPGQLRTEALRDQLWESLKAHRKTINRIADLGPGAGDEEIVKGVFCIVAGELRRRDAIAMSDAE